MLNVLPGVNGIKTGVKLSETLRQHETATFSHGAPYFAHSNPFVLGSISRIRSSREQAPRSARANALKIASIL